MGSYKIAAEHIPRVERAYISGGGPLLQTDHNVFLFTVNNYGKTPGILAEYAVEFCPLNNIPTVPAYDSPGYQRTRLRDYIAPETSGRIIAGIPIPASIQRPLLAYGRHWYQDIWNEEHSAGFVLVIESNGTHGGIPAGIPLSYTSWR